MRIEKKETANGPSTIEEWDKPTKQSAYHPMGSTTARSCKLLHNFHRNSGELLAAISHKAVRLEAEGLTNSQQPVNA
tara:strand:- start:350 stop:580 length:231 start_codon:yes stop_codon:yes gene_type:complete